jgi:plasmid stability protein
MKRTQIQLDERTYAALRRRAYERGCSISALARELLTEALGTRPAKKRLSLKDFSFVGAGRSEQGELAPVSERHDEALAQALYDEHQA